MARCTIDAVNDPSGVPLYSSNHMDHPLEYLKQGTEVGTLTPPQPGPLGHGTVREVNVTLTNRQGWVYTANLACHPQ